MTYRDPRPGPRGVRRARVRGAGRRRGRHVPGPALALVLLALFGSLTSLGRAQPRAELVLGVAGEPVAGAWNPLRALVRDAPGARLLVEIDAGGLERGEVIQRVQWTFPDASGVQRLDLDLPLPTWRRLTWRIEHGARTLASGSLPVRERDERPLVVIVSSDVGRWDDAVPAGTRPVPAASGELPTRAAAWDGVAAAIFDGSAAAPGSDAVLAAAAAGVHVLLPAADDAGHAALAPLLDPDGLRVGAGGIQPLPIDEAGVRAVLAPIAGDPASGDGDTVDASVESERAAPDTRATPAGRAPLALSPATRHLLRTGAAEALPATEWGHLPRGLVALLAGGYAAAVWAVLRLGGPAGVVSGLMLVAVASALTPRVAPLDTTPVREGAVVVAAGGVGVRSDLREVARLPSGEVELPGVLAPLEPTPVLWSDGVTRLPLEPGGRARLIGAPRVVEVPEGLHEAANAGGPAGVPDALSTALPEGVRAIADGSSWWLVRIVADDVADVVPPMETARRRTARLPEAP